MPSQLSSLTYIFLVLVNSLIGFVGFYSIGLSERTHAKVNELISNRHLINYNHERIYSMLDKNCSDLLREFPDLKICQDVDTSVFLTKLTVVISTLYNAYLPYALYGQQIRPVAIMIVASYIIGCAQFLEDVYMLRMIELMSVMAGFAMVIGQCFVTNYNDEIKYYWRRLRRRAAPNGDNHLYDNVRPNTHEHQN